MLPIAASNTFGDSTLMCVPSQSLSEPTRPYFVPYMNAHISVETTAGTAYGKNEEMRKNFMPCSFIESSASAINAASPSMIGTCTSVKITTLPTELQNSGSWNRRV